MVTGNQIEHGLKVQKRIEELKNNRDFVDIILGSMRDVNHVQINNIYVQIPSEFLAEMFSKYKDYLEKTEEYLKVKLDEI